MYILQCILQEFPVKTFGRTKAGASRGKGRRGGGSAGSAAGRLTPAGIPVWFFDIELVFGLQGNEVYSFCGEFRQTRGRQTRRHTANQRTTNQTPYGKPELSKGILRKALYWSDPSSETGQWRQARARAWASVAVN
jgi:hypothetical protein